MPMCNRWLFRNVRTLIGNPDAGVCPNGASSGHVRHAGSIQVLLRYRLPVSLAMPDEISCGGRRSRNLTHRCTKTFAITERRKITVGVEAYNLFNHPNFGVPSNTQSPLSLGGNGDAVFKDAAGNFADNAGQILTTAGTGAPDSTGRPVYVLKGASLRITSRGSEDVLLWFPARINTWLRSAPATRTILNGSCI